MAFRGQAFEILASSLGRHHQGHDAGIGRDDQVLGQPAFQPQARHAKRPVLIVHMGVERVVTRLGDAPGHAALFAVVDLPAHHRPVSLVEQRVLIGGHDQQRHQVFEHRAAPAQERRRSAGRGQHAAQREPVFLADLALGNREKLARRASDASKS